MSRKLFSFFVTSPLIILATIVMGTFSFITSFFDSTGRSQHAMARFWSKILLSVSYVKVVVEGIEKIDPTKGYVLVANHASYMDIPVIVAKVPLQFRFYAKKELFRIPFMGTHLRRSGHIPVLRNDPRAALKSMGEGAKLIREKNVSVLLFPEGGRRIDGLGEFKEGPAFIAIKAGVPAIPIGLEGMRNIMKMHSTVIHPGTVHLRIGDPIDTSNLTPRDREALTHELRNKIAVLCGEPQAAN